MNEEFIFKFIADMTFPIALSWYLIHRLDKTLHEILLTMNEIKNIIYSRC